MYSHDPMPGWSDPLPYDDECAFCGGVYVCECTNESMTRFYAYELVRVLGRYNPMLADGYLCALEQFDPEKQMPRLAESDTAVCPSEQCNCSDCLPF